MKDVLTFFLDYQREAEPGRARKLKFLTFAILLSSILSGGMHTALIGVINKGIATQDFSFTLLYIFIGLCIAMPFTNFLASNLLNIFLIDVSLGMQENFCRQILIMPLRSLEKHGSGKLAAVLSDDIKTISEALLAFLRVAMHGALVLTCLAYMAWLSWQALVLTLIFLVFGLIGYQLIVVKGQAHLRTARGFYSQMFSHFTTLTGGNKELKLHSRRRNVFFSEVFEPTLKNLRDFIYRGNTIYNAGRGFAAVIHFMMIGIIVFGFAYYNALEMEVLTGFSLCLLYILGPLQSVVDGLIRLDRAKIAVDKVKELGITIAHAKGEEDIYREGVDDPLPEFASIEFKDVVYHYSEEEATYHNRFGLGPLNFSLHPGEVIFITGGNGSGKTTLAKIITGLYAPESGEVLYNGLAINHQNRDAYRQSFSAVFLDFHLFDSLLGLEAPDIEEKADKYLKTLQIDHKVEVSGTKLSTVNLSQGQRKRLAMLTAYLEDRSIYVFDEWTANQDPHFREVFYKEIIPELKALGKTVIAITHDDKYFDYGDRVLKLDFGQVEADILNKKEVS